MYNVRVFPLLHAYAEAERRRRFGCNPLTAPLAKGGWSAPPSGRDTPWKDPVPSVQEAGWAAGPVTTGTENPRTVYRLRYAGRRVCMYVCMRTL
jgi:hypothetical protein